MALRWLLYPATRSRRRVWREGGGTGEVQGMERTTSEVREGKECGVKEEKEEKGRVRKEKYRGEERNEVRREMLDKGRVRGVGRRVGVKG